MSYCINKIEGKIKFKKENSDIIVKTLSNKKFKWCDTFDYDEYVDDDIDIFEVFYNLRYDLIEEDNYYSICDFLGDKYGEDDIIFNTIAPHCENGYMKFRGEDGNTFKFIIKDKQFKQK